MNPTTTETIAAVLFVLAILYTFLAPKIASLGHRFPKHEGCFICSGKSRQCSDLVWRAAHLPVRYRRHEGWHRLYRWSQLYRAAVRHRHHGDRGQQARIARCQTGGHRAGVMLLPRAVAFYRDHPDPGAVVCLFITEPAAMTLGAFMLRDRFYRLDCRRGCATRRWACCSSTSPSVAY